MTETPSIHAQAPAEDSWLPIARMFREAFRAVRPGQEQLECLPGEKDACGGDAASHVLASAALLGAMGLHHAEHVGVHRVTEFWEAFDAHRITLARHHGEACDCPQPGA